MIKKQEITNEQAILQEIEKQKQEKKILPKEQLDHIHKRVFTNLMIATVIIVYFIFIILGYVNIKREAFLIDLRVFSLAILLGAILLFEKSYQKDNGTICIYGIETLALAIVTLVSIYVCILFETKFVLLVAIASYSFAIYYIAKAIVIHKKMTKEYIKSLSDIKEIVKKEEPEKVIQTKKKKEIKKQEETIKTTKKGEKTYTTSSKKETQKKQKEEGTKQKTNTAKSKIQEKTKEQTKKKKVATTKEGKTKTTSKEKTKPKKEIKKEKSEEKS